MSREFVRRAVACAGVLTMCATSGSRAVLTAVVDKDTGRPLAGTTLTLRLPSGAEQQTTTDARGAIVLPAAAVETGVTLTHPHYLKADATPWSGEGDTPQSLVLARPDPTHAEYPQPGNLVFGFGATYGVLSPERDDGFLILDVPGEGRIARGLRPDEMQFDAFSLRAGFAQAAVGLSRIGGASEFLDLALVGRFGGGVAELHSVGAGPDLKSSAEPYWSLGLNARARWPCSPLYLAAGFHAGRLEESVLSDQSGQLRGEQIRLEHLFAAGHLGVGCLFGDLAGRPVGTRGRCSLELGAAWQGIATDVRVKDVIDYERTVRERRERVVLHEVIVGYDVFDEPIWGAEEVVVVDVITRTELVDAARTVEQDLIREEALSGYLILGVPLGRRDMGYARVNCERGGGWGVALVFARWLPFVR